MDLLFKKSALTNGGVISGNQYNSPLQFEELFQSPTAYEMTTGLTDYKKVFAHFSDNAANLWVKRIRPVLIKQTVGGMELPDRLKTIVNDFCGKIFRFWKF